MQFVVRVSSVPDDEAYGNINININVAEDDAPAPDDPDAELYTYKGGSPNGSLDSISK